MFYRPPACRWHHPPLDSFRCVVATAARRSLSADFTELLTVSVSAYTASRSIKGSVSRRYPVIPLLGLSVLLRKFSLQPFTSLREWAIFRQSRYYFMGGRIYDAINYFGAYCAGLWLSWLFFGYCRLHTCYCRFRHRLHCICYIASKEELNLIF